MAKLTRQDLKRLRETRRSELGSQETVQVIVAMGTSGIAAGARETLAMFEAEIVEHQATHVLVRKAGSLGLDHAEPTVEVRMPDMPRVIYGNVTAEVAQKIFRKHILGKTLINDHIFDSPAADIVPEKE